VPVASRGRAAGLAVQPLSPLALAHDCGAGLLLGFTNVTEAGAPDAAARIVCAIGDWL
jgi:hypothetical protein